MDYGQTVTYFICVNDDWPLNGGVSHLSFPCAKQELKGSKRGNSVSSTPEGEESELTKSKGVQLSITEFYRSAKVLYQAKPADDIVDDSKSFRDGSSKKKSKGSSSNFSKSARRRLLFDS